MPPSSGRPWSRKLFWQLLASRSSRWSWRSTAVSAWETRVHSRATTRCSREDTNTSPVYTLSANVLTSALTAWMSRQCFSSTRRIRASISCHLGRACSSAQISPSILPASPPCNGSSVSGGSGWNSAGVSKRDYNLEEVAGDTAGSSIVCAVRSIACGDTTM